MPDSSLAILTPSYIGSVQRVEWARQTLGMLERSLGRTYPHYVVADLPDAREASTGDHPPQGANRSVYAAPHIRLLERRGPGGSASALVEATRWARRDGHELGLIHLDDLVYVPNFGELCRHAVDAFAHDSDLRAVRFGGHPLLSDICDPKVGNRSLIRVKKHKVKFENVVLRPTRHPDYTLWSTPYEARMVRKGFWAVSMWMMVYRLDFLERLLTFGEASSMRHLADIERYYRDRGVWKAFLRTESGRIGFINMQFGGIDLHHHKQWAQLIQYPNVPVR